MEDEESLKGSDATVEQVSDEESHAGGGDQKDREENIRDRRAKVTCPLTPHNYQSCVHRQYRIVRTGENVAERSGGGPLGFALPLERQLAEDGIHLLMAMLGQKPGRCVIHQKSAAGHDDEAAAQGLHLLENVG